MVSRTRFFICLGSLVAIATASGAGLEPTRRPSLTEPLEKYDNPPAYIFRLETSPRMVSQYDTFTSYQVNVDANGHNILGDAANEPSEKPWTDKLWIYDLRTNKHFTLKENPLNRVQYPLEHARLP